VLKEIEAVAKRLRAALRRNARETGLTFLTTSGIGLVPAGRDLGPERMRVGDAILVSGPIGDHSRHHRARAGNRAGAGHADDGLRHQPRARRAERRAAATHLLSARAACC
jgi:thiamine monophosphate kinase